MAAKTTGAEFLAFYTDDAYWTEGMWHEEESVWINGVLYEGHDGIGEVIKPSDSIKIDGGFIVNTPDGSEPTFDGYFKKWKRAQTTASFVVSGPKDRSDELKAMLKAKGFKVEG